MNNNPAVTPRPRAEIEQEREERISSVDGSTVGGAALFVAAIVFTVAFAF